MYPIRFLHAADLHLDSPFQGLQHLPEPLLGVIRESTFTALDRFVDLAVRENVDFVLLCGDIYDLADMSLRAQLRFQRAMRKLAERDIRAFVVSGNHDPLNGQRASLDWPDTVHWFSGDGVETVPVYGKNGEVTAYVHGISYARSAVTENLASRFRAIDDGKANIALLHTNVDGDSGHDNYAPCRMADLLGSGMHYWALGHIHKRNVLHTEPHIVYPGNMQGRNMRETGAKGCYLVDMRGPSDIRLYFRELDVIRWTEACVDVGGMDTEQQLRDALADAVEDARLAADGRALILRLKLEGRTGLHAWLRKDRTVRELMQIMREEQEAAERSGDGFVWIESIRDSSALPVDVDRLLAQDGFLGDLLRFARACADDADQLAAVCAEAWEPMNANPKTRAAIARLNREEREQLLREAMELAVEYLAEEEDGKR